MSFKHVFLGQTMGFGPMGGHGINYKRLEVHSSWSFVSNRELPYGVLWHCLTCKRDPPTKRQWELGTILQMEGLLKIADLIHYILFPFNFSFTGWMFLDLLSHFRVVFLKSPMPLTILHSLNLFEQSLTLCASCCVTSLFILFHKWVLSVYIFYDDFVQL